MIFRKTVLIASALASVSAGASDILKSAKLRAMACEKIENFLDDEGLKLKYETTFGDEVEVLPDFHKECRASKQSFTVSGSEYNEKASAVTEMTVLVNLKISGSLYVHGPFTLKRSAFDPNTGDVKLGEWKLTSARFGFELGPNSVRQLAKALASVADTHNGDASIAEFKAMDYSASAELEKLTRDVETRNKETLDDAKNDHSEEEIENGEVELCLMSDVDDSAEGIFLEAENRGSYTRGGEAVAIYELLKKKGWVYNVIGYQSTQWLEWCAFHFVSIYLKNGTVIVLDYDFTT